jgi:FkbM family methyltransferase
VPPSDIAYGRAMESAPPAVNPRLRSAAIACARIAGRHARFAPVLRGVRRLLRWCDASAPGSWRSRLGAALHTGFEPNALRTASNVVFRPKYLDVLGTFGERYRVDVNDHIGWNVFLKGHFDLTPIAVVRWLDRIRPGGVFLDVGANIGSTSIPVAKHGIPSIGIEASPTVLRECAANVALNSPIPLSLLNVAVSSPARCEDGRYAEIFSPSGNAGASSLFATWNPSRAGSKVELVRLTTLDRIISFLGLDHITLIKIDIEGAEFAALEGLRGCLERSRPFVLYEWRPDVFRRSGIEIMDVASLFPSGYAFRAVTSERRVGAMDIRFAAFQAERAYENVLAIPSEDGMADALRAGLVVVPC